MNYNQEINGLYPPLNMLGCPTFSNGLSPEKLYHKFISDGFLTDKIKHKIDSNGFLACTLQDKLNMILSALDIPSKINDPSFDKNGEYKLQISPSVSSPIPR